MKLKKLFLAAGVALMAMGATAQTNVEDIRIYINPGHGSWGPNNRHCATIGHDPISTEDPDTTDFFESNTNLQKCLALFHRLKDYGFKHDAANAKDLTQNLVMSHIACGPYPYDNTKDETLGYIPDDQQNEYNRKLSEIAAEVEANNFDMFISVHSNAATDGNTVNYLYFAYDDDFTGNDKTLSIEMSRCGWNHRILDRHTQWTHYDYTMTAADVAAGKGKIGYQGLGVLNHSVSGYLVEGYFHTYQPARHRAMNFDVDQLEGLAYARGVADYFGIEKESTGEIYGIVRDKNEKFSHTLYTPNAATPDIYKPLNGVEVILKQGEAVVAKDTTDVNYNGAFVFKNLAPGEYTVEFSHPDYKADTVYNSTNATAEPVVFNVTVSAAATSYPLAFLENKSYVPPTFIPVNYPDSLADKNFALAEEINFTDEYKNNTVAELAGKKIRRSIVRNNLQYILAFDADNAPYVYVYDTDSKALVKTLGTTAAVGDIYKLSDIAMTADGYLVGINKVNQAYGGSNNVTAYKWENDENGVPDGELAVWWTNNFAGNWSNGIGGETMAYSGSLAEGKMIYTGTTTSSNGNTRLIIATISDGSYLGYMRNNQDGTYLTTSYMGTDYKMTVSPNGDDKLIVNSATIQPFELQLNTTDAGLPTIIGSLAEGVLATSAVNESYFKYAGKSVMVAPAVDENGNVTGVELVDVTDGLGNAVKLVLQGTSVATIEAAEVASTSAMAANAELSLTIDAVSGYTTAADIELFLTVDGNISKFTTKDVKQPVYSGVYAYNLAMSQNGDTYTLIFNLNDKSSDVEVVLVPTSEDGEEVVYTLGALEAGAHSVDVDAATLSGSYTWKVSVANKTISSGEILTTINTWGASASTYFRGGIAVETNPESDNFGTTYLSVARSKGIYLYNPMYERLEGAPYWAGQFNASNSSSTFRVALYNDKLYVTDWSDAYPGIWIFDPANPTAINNIFAGATNDGTGKLTIDGVAVGGGSTGVAFTGSGDSRKMFIYVEDLPDGNAGNKVYRYDIGANDTWGAVAPTLLSEPTAKLVNTNTGMLGSALHNVVFCSQTRYSGSNTAGVPAFLVINEDGNIIFNGADLVETLDGCYGGGMALNADETKFAIVDGSANIQVYDVTWTDNVPSFTHSSTLASNDQDICQMAFDYSGNLHCINRKHGYYVHAVPCEARDVVTPAKAELVITGTSSGVENIEIEAENAEDVAPVYYNLQGVQVVNPENGIYIVKRGNKVTKEYIRK